MPVIASSQITIIDLNDSKQLTMYIGASQARTIIYDNISTYTPNYSVNNQILTPQLFIGGLNTDITSQASSIKWYYQINGAGSLIEITSSGSDYTLGSGEVKTLTIKSNVMHNRTSMTYICEIIYRDVATNTDIPIKAEIEIVKIFNGKSGGIGANAVLGVLNNETHALPATSEGVVTSYGGASTYFSVYNGSIDDTANWTILQNRSAGTSVTESTSSRTATVTAVATDTASVTFTASRAGYSDVVKVFNLTKIKGGISGMDSTSYWISTPPVIQKNNLKEYTPRNIDIQFKAQSGQSDVVDYQGRMTIEDTSNGITYNMRYTSTANESYKNYTPLPDIKALRVRMHLAGVVPNGTNHIDEQVIPIVSDGADPIFASVWNPEGNTIKNGQGSVKSRIDLYKGTDLVVGSSYKWYLQDPTATVSSGGDTDGGNGWRLINQNYNLGITGYNTNTIVIPPDAVFALESFKGMLTYNGVKYSGVTTVVDLSDPILVRLDGLDKFKNGQGTTVIRATLIRAGEELDASGTKYVYRWSIYDSENVKTSFQAIGKSITVRADDIDGRGNLICEVSD